MCMTLKRSKHHPLWFGISGYEDPLWPLVEFDPGSPWFNFPAALVNSQLVCLQPVGILNSCCCSVLSFRCVSLALKSPYGERSIKYVLYCMSLKKPGRTSHAWHRFIWLVKIGGPLFVSRAKCMWKQINPLVTVLEQGRKVIDFYLIHSWFLDVKWGKSETQVDHIRPLHWGKTIKREHNTELYIIRTMTMKGEQKNFNWEYTHSGTDTFSRVAQSFQSLYVIQRNFTALTKRWWPSSQYNVAVSIV